MKKILILSVICMVLIILISCEKQSPRGPDDPPVTVKPTVKLLIEPSPEGKIMPYGTKFTVSWTSSGGNSWTLNDESVEPSGSMTIWIFQDTKFNFKVTAFDLSRDLSSVDSDTIEIGDWTTSNLGLLTYKEPWMLKDMRVIQEDEVVADLILDEEQLTDLRYYYLNGTFIGVKYNYATDGIGVAEAMHSNGILFGNGTWSLSKDGTHFSNEVLITKLTKNELIIDTQREDQTYNGKPAIFRCEYYRP